MIESIGPYVHPDTQCYQCIMCHCNKMSHLAENVFELTPYFYPWSIEFSIIVVGVWYIMWANIGKVAENRKTGMHLLPERRDSINSVTGSPINKAMEVYADCQSATKGLLLGLASLALMMVGMIVYSIMSKSDDPHDADIAIVLFSTFVSLILFFMVATTAMVFYQVSKFEVNPNPISFLDDMLLLICLPFIFFYCLLMIWPAFTGHDHQAAANIITSFLTLIQVGLQTLMIVDGLRRCSNNEKDQVERRGKNLLTFLIVTNLSMYLWETLETKPSGPQGVFRGQIEFYGEELWTVLIHTTQPLTIFYRFHSAVALADIWNSAYSPGHYH